VATKEQLEASVKELDAEVNKLSDKLRIAQAETRRFEQDATRANQRIKDCESSLDSIKGVVAAWLSAKHGVGTTQQGEYFQGKYVSTEQDSEDIRLLRHLYGLASSDVPF
jgi:septal ring factor EnvC (AmiA/AmiB activator)